MTEHVETDRCGFDRNESHSQDCYVCTCGWSERTGEMGVSVLLRQWASSTLNQSHAAVQFDAAARIEQLERELAAALRSANRSPGDVEIRLNPDGTLDEVCAPGVHLEQMAGNSWFLSVGEVNLWFNAKGKITVTYEDNRQKEG